MGTRLLYLAVITLLAACTDTRSADHVLNSRTSPTGVGIGTHTPWVTGNTIPWTCYRTFTFAAESLNFSSADRPKITEIVAYIASDSTLDVGIDGTWNSEDITPDRSSLRIDRAASIRDALMEDGAGVASYKIFTGAFTDSGQRRADQIQVLIGPRSGILRRSASTMPEHFLGNC